MAINFPNNPQLNDSYTQGNRSWSWNGVYWRATSTTIGYTGSAGAGFTGSAGYIGSQGDLGYTGSQGATGTSVRIVGSLADQSLLPDPYGGDIGDGYLVEDTGHLWLWNGTAWNDIGQLTGEVGPTGFVGSQGLSIIDTELVDDELIITFEDSTQNNVGNVRGFVGSQGESTFAWGPTAPVNPAVGARWYDTKRGFLVVYVDDGDSLQWVEVSATGFLGQPGYTGSSGGVNSVTTFPTTINSNVTIAVGENGLSVGPLTQASGTVITIAAGQRWIIL